MDFTAELPACRCSLCWGLQEYGLAHGKDYGLPRSPGCGYNQPIRLNVQTIGPTPEGVISLPTARPDVCDGSYTCPCSGCTADKTKRHRKSLRRKYGIAA